LTFFFVADFDLSRTRRRRWSDYCFIKANKMGWMKLHRVRKMK